MNVNVNGELFRRLTLLRSMRLMRMTFPRKKRANRSGLIDLIECIFLFSSFFFVDDGVVL